MANNFPWVPLLVIVGIVVGLGIVFSVGYWAFADDTIKQHKPISEAGPKWAKAKFLDYIFGDYSAYLAGKVGVNSAIIITIAVWFFFFLTFGDIFAQFSSFDKWVSWTLGFIIAIIMANVKGPIVYLGAFFGIFSFLGAIAVIVGLIASFVVFIAVNWGVMSLGPWIVQRRMMMHAATASAETEAGGQKLAGVIKGLGKVGDAMRAEGKKK